MDIKKKSFLSFFFFLKFSVNLLDYGSRVSTKCFEFSEVDLVWPKLIQWLSSLKTY